MVKLTGLGMFLAAMLWSSVPAVPEDCFSHRFDKAKQKRSIELARQQRRVDDGFKALRQKLKED